MNVDAFTSDISMLLNLYCSVINLQSPASSQYWFDLGSHCRSLEKGFGKNIIDVLLVKRVYCMKFGCNWNASKLEIPELQYNVGTTRYVLFSIEIRQIRQYLTALVVKYVEGFESWVCWIHWNLTLSIAKHLEHRSPRNTIFIQFYQRSFITRLS